jgi:hypothetical protein
VAQDKQRACLLKEQHKIREADEARKLTKAERLKKQTPKNKYRKRVHPKATTTSIHRPKINSRGNGNNNNQRASQQTITS